MNKNVLLGVVALAVLLLIIFVTMNGDSVDDSALEGQTENTEDVSEGISLRIGENAIYLADQKPGNMVNVSMAVLGGKGYVVIHETKDGKPGKVLGASALLDAGENLNVPISLSAPLVDGQAYVAMLHIDDGDGKFDAAKDAPAKNEGSDSAIMMEFEADTEADSGAEIVI